jgi:tRNA-splicing ligase RtcB
MDIRKLEKRDDQTWVIPMSGDMRVPGVLYASEELVRDMDDKVAEQVCNVATLPGIVGASYAMPDAHWGYGFPIGGVAAFDPHEGVVSAGGVGFDISCGVRLLTTGLTAGDVRGRLPRLADALFGAIPAGVGSKGRLRLSDEELDAMLRGGARWAVEQGYGEPADLERVEEQGAMAGAEPEHVSHRAKQRQRPEVGTLGSGNHYLELQRVTAVNDADTATELACAPLGSDLGRRYLGAMRAGINCALANRQVITHLTREVLAKALPDARLALLYDVSHNTCKEETHDVEGEARRLFVHRKGATRAFPPGHGDLPDSLRAAGQPVLIGGTMGTASYVLAGEAGNDSRSFSSACHGAGRAMSRNAARKRWRGGQVVRELEQRGIFIRSPSMRGIAEEAPDAYKDVSAVVDAADRAGLSRTVARLEPLVCIKG